MTSLFDADPLFDDDHGPCVACRHDSYRVIAAGVFRHSVCDPPASPPSVRRSDPSTSALAARNVHRSRLRADVLRQHQLAPDGLADFELYERLPDDHPPSIVKRRGDLTHDGILESTGRRRVTPRGAWAIVWQLAGR